jgi:uncharacterized protein
MGTRERYDHGVFSYVELGTSDAEAAKAFYERLFGWSFRDVPVGDGITYHPASKDDQPVAALYESTQRPAWTNYVTVDDVDETTGKVGDLGGTVITEPYDVMDMGRMSVVQDPTGGVVALWQAKDNIGASLVNAPGALAWNDLQTTDVEAASEFYAELLGWEIGEVEGAPDERRGIKVGEGMNGGMAKLAEAAADNGVPSHWLAFFGVEDAEATAKAAEEAGGSVVAGPLDVPAGKMAVLTDPQGVMFGVVDGDFDD